MPHHTTVTWPPQGPPKSQNPRNPLSVCEIHLPKYRNPVHAYEIHSLKVEIHVQSSNAKNQNPLYACDAMLATVLTVAWVCHNFVFYRNEWTDRAGFFCMESTQRHQL